MLLKQTLFYIAICEIKNWLPHSATITDNFECFVIYFTADSRYQLLVARSDAVITATISTPCFVVDWMCRGDIDCSTPRRRRSGLGGGMLGSF